MFIFKPVFSASCVNLMDFLVRYKLLNSSQHGCLKARSCLTNMLFFGGEEISKWLDERSAVDIIYLDFQKPFDKVPHQRLLLKLKHGHGNLDVNYKMGDTVLSTTVKEKDLGVTISADMKVSEQCGIAASKGNKILGLIRRNITYKKKS